MPSSIDHLGAEMRRKEKKMKLYAWAHDKYRVPNTLWEDHEEFVVSSTSTELSVTQVAWHVVERLRAGAIPVWVWGYYMGVGPWNVTSGGVFFNHPSYIHVCNLSELKEVGAMGGRIGDYVFVVPLYHPDQIRQYYPDHCRPPAVWEVILVSERKEGGSDWVFKEAQKRHPNLML